MVKGLAPKRLDPARYHLNPSTERKRCRGAQYRMSLESSSGSTTLVESIRGLPSIEPDATSKHIFVASMIHTSMRSPVLRDTPDVTCAPDFAGSDRRKEVVHHEQIPDQDVSKLKKNATDKKSNFVIKAKSIPVTSKAVASSQGGMRERWLVSIHKEVENFLQNMAVEDLWRLFTLFRGKGCESTLPVMLKRPKTQC